MAVGPGSPGWRISGGTERGHGVGGGLAGRLLAAHGVAVVGADRAADDSFAAVTGYHCPDTVGGGCGGRRRADPGGRRRGGIAGETIAGGSAPSGDRKSVV